MHTAKRLFWSFIIIILALTPTWLFIGGRSLFNPTGFFQEFFILGIGIWFLGGIQLVLAILGFYILSMIRTLLPVTHKKSANTPPWDPIGEAVRRGARNQSKVLKAAMEGKDYPEDLE